MGGEWGATGEQAMGLACSASNANWGKCELGKTNSETVLPALQVQTIHKTLNCATKIKPVQQLVAIPPVGLCWICASPKFHPGMTRGRFVDLETADFRVLAWLKGAREDL
jgi:hypothetical protein